MTAPVHVAYFSDVLCVWAYVSQIRLDELEHRFGEQVAITHHFMNLFGDTEHRIGHGWADRGGYAGFHDHVISVGKGFPHAPIHPSVWTDCRPRSSALAHLFAKAVQQIEAAGGATARCSATGARRSLAEEFVWRVRGAFFAEARDIGLAPTLFEIAAGLGIDTAAIERYLDDGSAIAAWCRDLEKKDSHRVEGSPTYVLNEGRQKLYGNVGYLIIEANVVELFAKPEGQASWC